MLGQMGFVAESEHSLDRYTPPVTEGAGPSQASSSKGRVFVVKPTAWPGPGNLSCVQAG